MTTAIFSDGTKITRNAPFAYAWQVKFARNEEKLELGGIAILGRTTEGFSNSRELAEHRAKNAPCKFYEKVGEIEIVETQCT